MQHAMLGATIPTRAPVIETAFVRPALDLLTKVDRVIMLNTVHLVEKSFHRV